MAASLESFDTLVERAKRPGDLAALTALLKFMRLNRVRESRIVLEFGERALRKFGRSLGDEKWPIYEQVFIASLDTGDIELARSCLEKLNDQFKESSRVERLKGLFLEAQQQYGDAERIYDSLLEKNPANALAMKRRVSIFKGKGDYKGAIKEINSFLEKYQADASAWQELGNIYLSLSKYDSAAFCFEELILHDCMNHMHHCRLAEIYYTMGRYPDARKHFSQSLDIKLKENARAMHGLAACCHAIAEDKKAKGGEVNTALFNFASGELSKLYGGGCLAKGVESLLEVRRASIDP